MKTVIRYLRRAALLEMSGGPTDGQLLESFLDRREEAAFEALLRRHGPMVLGVCLRVLGNPHAAEDAFQATFLVLVRKASTIRPREMVGHWLYGVAYRTAMKARAMNAKRRTKERQARRMPRSASPADGAPEELLERLDAELTRLPEKYRVPVVLCELEGKSRKEAARLLGLAEGTLSWRLAQARKMLARKLSQYGTGLSAIAVSALLSEGAASAYLSPDLLVSTTKAVLTAGPVPARVAALTEGVIKAMLQTKLKMTIWVAALALLASAGATGLVFQATAEEPKQEVYGPQVGKHYVSGQGGGLLSVRTDELNNRILEMEKQRVAVIQKVQPSVVAVVSNGGSGVLISDDGYALTNHHVAGGAAGGTIMKCGLPDGILYDAVLVGTDKVGDVSLIKLLPKKEGDKFPFSKLGDSDKLQAGDWSLAMGNPFLLATDYTPTVTFGMISGVHRYQYPAGTLLEYGDCIQIDTSINPGNSGGPLFNMDGELIGINGRGSFEKRGRVNSGVGYAISINQIKNFLGQLKAGMDTDHATLGVAVRSDSDEGAISKVLVSSFIESDARRRGLDLDDQLVSFAGRPISTVNQYKNILSIFPRGWRVPITFRHENEKKQIELREVLVRLMGVQAQQLGGQQPGAQPQPAPAQPRPAANASKSKLFEAKPGFVNYYFNKLEQKRLLAAFHQQGDFSKLTGDWGLGSSGTLFAGAGARGKRVVAEFNVKTKGGKGGQNDVVRGLVDGLDYSLEPLNEEKAITRREPPESGGLLMALYQYRQMLVYGPQGFADGFSHGGVEPFYPPKEQGQVDYSKRRVDAEVIRTRHAAVDGKWYFSTAQDETAGQLLGFEIWLEREEDPCEVYLFDYKKVDGGKLPHRLAVCFGDKTYANLKVNSWKKEAGK